MILAKLNKWDDSSGLTHVSTDWQIGKNTEFTELADSVEKSTTMLALYYSTVEIPKDTTYYIRARRNFTDNVSGAESTGEWCEYITASNIEESYSNVMLGKDPYILQPYVYVTEEAVRSSSESLTITTSSFQSNIDTHYSTHWLVYDQNDKILFSKMDDRANLTSITIDNLITFKQREKLTFVAIHKGVTGVESKPAKKVIKMADDYGFTVKTNLNNVPVLETLKIEFETTDKALGMYINRVELAKFDTNETIIALEHPQSNIWTIPYYYLKANAKYNLKVYTNNAYGTELDIVYLTLSVMDIKKVVVKDNQYQYKKKVIQLQTSVTKSNTIPDGVYSEATFDNRILIPDTTTQKMKIFQSSKENDTYFLRFQNKYADGINLPHAGPYENMVIKVINNTRILIDMLNENQKPTFYVYSYDIATQVYTLLQTATREDETVPLGKSFALAQISTEKIIYNVYGTDILKEFNILTGAITTLSAEGKSPITGMTKGILLRCRNNRIFIGNGTTYDAVTYNYENHNYETGYVFGPQSFINRELRTIPLINGSTLVAKYDLTDIEEDGSLLYFDYETGSFETLHIPFQQVLPTSAIMLSTGEIFCTYSPVNDIQYYSIFT